MDLRALLEANRRKHQLGIVDSAVNWHHFYLRNGRRFFKNRHWILNEFPEISEYFKLDEAHFMDVGCGVGDLLFPLYEKLKEADSKVSIMHGCDLADEAIRLANERTTELGLNKAFDFWQCDAAQNCCTNPLRDHLGPQKVKVASLVFVLSAIRPDRFDSIIRNVAEVMENDGMLIFRDYAFGDKAMSRFKSEQRTNDKQFVRSDGTRSYFFELEEVRNLFEKEFRVIELKIVERECENVKLDVRFMRVFVQGKFVKK